MKSFGGTPRGARLERIKASPRWAGERFRNVHPIMPGLRDPNASMPTIREFLCDGERRMPRRPLPSMNPLETWTRPAGSGLRVTWLGHSTVLIEIDGLRVLTDPVWGPRASLSRLAGPKRFQPVPVPLRAMPPIDLVIVSHDHYDHLDYPTIPQLRNRLGPFDLVMLEVGAFHPAWGDIHLGPENALKALALLGGAPFLPVHWGTFSLAMHAWDQPAEALLTLGPKAGARLVMPRLGEPVEPAHADGFEPWWRVVDASAREPDAPEATTLPEAVPWPLD